jgi:hypothetical protein
MNSKQRVDRKGLNLEFNAAERAFVDCLMAENKCSPTKAVKIALQQLQEFRAKDCRNTTPNKKEFTNGKSNK